MLACAMQRFLFSKVLRLPPQGSTLLCLIREGSTPLNFSASVPIETAALCTSSCSIDISQSHALAITNLNTTQHDGYRQLCLQDMQMRFYTSHTLMPSFIPPAHNPRSLKPIEELTEPVLNAKISASIKATDLAMLLARVDSLKPSSISLLLSYLSGKPTVLFSDSSNEGTALRMMLASSVQQVDVFLHLMNPDELCEVVFTLAQLQEQICNTMVSSEATKATVSGLPRRVVSMLLGDSSALLNQAGKGAVVRLATGLEKLGLSDFLKAVQVARESS